LLGVAPSEIAALRSESYCRQVCAASGKPGAHRDGDRAECDRFRGDLCESVVDWTK